MSVNKVRKLMGTKTQAASGTVAKLVCFCRKSRAAGYCHGNGGYMAAPQLLPAEGRALRAMGHRNGYGNEAPLLPAHKPGTLGPAAMSRACVATAKVCSAVLSPSKSQLSTSESDDKLTGCHPYKAKPSSGHSLLSKLKTYGLHWRVARQSFWPQGFR